MGRAAELRFCSLAILGSKGRLELVPPLADDERRDFEIHRKHAFGCPLSVQVRSIVHRDKRKDLSVHFYKGPRRPFNPGYWFFVAYLDAREMDFADPMFLIPSKALRRGNRLLRRAWISMAKNSRDQWVRYRITRRELGMRLAGLVDWLNSPERREKDEPPVLADGRQGW